MEPITFDHIKRRMALNVITLRNFTYGLKSVESSTRSFFISNEPRPRRSATNKAIKVSFVGHMTISAEWVSNFSKMRKKWTASQIRVKTHLQKIDSQKKWKWLSIAYLKTINIFIHTYNNWKLTIRESISKYIWLPHIWITLAQPNSDNNILMLT